MVNLVGEGQWPDMAFGWCILIGGVVLAEGATVVTETGISNHPQLGASDVDRALVMYADHLIAIGFLSIR